MDKKLKWTWHLDCADILSAEEMQDPQKLLASCEIVQDREDSTVFKRDGVFFKWYKRSFKNAWRKFRYRMKSTARREYLQIRLCQQAGLPVCEPLGYGQFDYSDSIIITREVKCPTVTEVIIDKFQQHDFEAEDFFKALGGFLEQCFKSGIYMPDIHTDNMMYDEKNNGFILIDVYGVRPMLIFNKRKYIRMCHSWVYRIAPYITAERYYYLMTFTGKCRNLNNFIHFTPPMLRHWLGIHPY